MARLSLCLNQVAKIRRQKKGHHPDPVALAIAAEMAGIDGIVVQLREDRSDITDRDITLLKEVIHSHFNLAIPLNDEMVKKVLNWLPDMVTLIPSASTEKEDTSLDVATSLPYVEEIVQTLRANNIVVTLLIDPDAQQIRAAARAQADYVQINTAPLAKIEDLSTMTDIVDQIRSAAIAAHKIGLGVTAGRALNAQTLRELVNIQYIEEFNIGWAIVSRAILVGIEKAIQDFKALVIH